MAKYFIRTAKTSGMATLYTRVQKSNPKVNLLISSQVKIDIKIWERANMTADKLTAFRQSKEGKKLFAKLDAVSSILEYFAKEDVFDKDSIDKAITAEIHKEEHEKEAQKKEEQAERERQEKEAADNDIIKCCADFCEGVKNQTIAFIYKGKSKAYSKNSVKEWFAFKKVLTDFYNHNAFTWADINDSLYLRWVEYLRGCGYMEMTINKYCKCLKHLIIKHLGKGVASSVVHKTFNIDAESKAVEIYLTADELQALYKMKLFGLKEQVRDVFLVGCYTAQRFSDYSTIKKEDFGITAKGTQVVRIKQQKTGTRVVIPVLNENLIRIFDKYQYNLPLVDGIIFNRYIKQICKELSETVPSLSELVPTVLTMKNLSAEKKSETPIYQRNENGQVLRPRYECVSSHTARRTAITLMYISHKYTDAQMMAVSGHKDLKTFNEYIKLSLDEKADEIAEASANDGLF